MEAKKNSFVANLPQAAREMRDIWGEDAQRIALKRAEWAREEGDQEAARGWREIAAACDPAKL
jgi:hypothetical protein